MQFINNIHLKINVLINLMGATLVGDWGLTKNQLEGFDGCKENSYCIWTYL